MIEEIKVPSLGRFDGAPVVALLAKVGDVVDAGDPLIEIGNEAASVELGGEVAGLVKEICVNVGDPASQNAIIALIDTDTDATKRLSTSEKTRSAPVEVGSGRESAPAEPPKASPSVPAFEPRKPSVPPAARAQAHRTGRAEPASRSAAAATHAAEGTGIPSVPPVDFAQFGAVEEVPLPRIQKVSGPALHRAWLNVPHVTHNDEVDITELDLYRKKMDGAAREDGYRVTLLSFVIKAVVGGLRDHWQINSSLHPDGGKLIRKDYYHIGFAADTPSGLMVPVIHDADRKGIVEISKELSDLSAKAREGRLKPDEMKGASFTISSLGGIGGTSFTPIVNTPKVAILGLTRTHVAPKWDGDDFVPRSMLPLSLSYDTALWTGRWRPAFACLSRSGWATSAS